MKRKYIGDRNFYKMVLAVAIPIMVQNGITNFVGLLDNIMVGRVGTEQMSGIAIVNQLMMVFNVSIFGAISGAGIFGAQFFGCGDTKGVRDTFRFKFYVCLAILVAGTAIFLLAGEPLILLYLHGEGNGEALEATLRYGRQYLLVMTAGLLPFVVEEIYASTLRECGETMLPMKAGVAAVFVNLVFNWLLIFGNLGFPRLGVIGAAAATVLSRYVQLAIVMIWTHRHAERMPFITGAYRSVKIPAQLAGKIFRKGMPLMVNEILWSAGMAVLMQCYSLRGLEAVAALNISGTISNVFNVVFMALGNAVAIIIGQLLGAGRMEEAQDTDRKLIAFTVLCCLAVGGVLVLAAPLFPRLYNTSAEIRRLAAALIRVAGVCMPIAGFVNSTYFTLRSGGKTVITFLFDSVFLWCASIPFAYVLSRYTALPIVALYLCCQMVDLIKCLIGYILVKKGVWVHNIVGNSSAAD